jgi:hypothetical protein
LRLYLKEHDNPSLTSRESGDSTKVNIPNERITMADDQATAQTLTTAPKPKSTMNVLTELVAEVSIPINEAFISLSLPADFFKEEVRTKAE